MKSELLHIKNPRKMLYFWIMVWSLLALISVYAIYRIADTIRLHQLPSGSVELTVPYSKYLVGEVISFTLKNSYNSPIYVTNECPKEPLIVYQKKATRWERIHDTTSVDKCPTQDRQIEIPANGEISGSFEPWVNLFDEPGMYRVVAYVEFYNELPYQEFEIIAQPTAEAAFQQNQSTATSSVPQSTQTTTQTEPIITTKKSETFKTNSGSISVLYDDSAIYVTSIAPAAGCTYEGGRSGPQVQVEFKCGGTETQVKLTLANGKIIQKIEADD